MFPVNEVNEVKPDGPRLSGELPFARRLRLDHLYSLANIETEQACNLAKPGGACRLILARFGATFFGRGVAVNSSSVARNFSALALVMRCCRSFLITTQPPEGSIPQFL